MPRLDWPLIRSRYVEGVRAGERTLWPTYPELAAEFGVREDGIRRRAAKEKWSEQRALFQRRVEIERQNARSAEIAKVGAELDIAAITMAKDGLTVTNARLQELGIQTQRRIQALQAEDPNPPPAVDALELERVSRAANEWYILGTRAMGTAPRITLEIESELDISEEVRDARTLGVLSILHEHAPHLVPPEVGEVIDLGPSGLPELEQRSPNGDGSGADAAHQ